jgi:hypothetical protein
LELVLYVEVHLKGAIIFTKRIKDFSNFVLIRVLVPFIMNYLVLPLNTTGLLRRCSKIT